MRNKLYHIMLIALLGFVCSGCSLSYNLNPTLSSNSASQYDQVTEGRKTIHIVDDRTDKQFSKGMGPLERIGIKIGNVDDPIAWFADSLQQEFAARGISVRVTTEKPAPGSSDPVLVINSYQIVSYRRSGFHPYVAYHSFSGKLQAPDGNNRVIAYFLYGKVPVWSMDEVQQPCFDLPESVLVKEVAAKINRFALHYKMRDDRVEELFATIQDQAKAGSADTYLTVLDLGESNNPMAMDHLKKLADNDDLLIRTSAISAIGMLGPEGQFDYLKGKYETCQDIDRFMAIKSIGDIGSPEAIAFLKKIQEDPMYSDDYGFKFAADLYLEAAKYK
jgi:PBS lyase HEAT-like repeat